MLVSNVCPECFAHFYFLFRDIFDCGLLEYSFTFCLGLNGSYMTSQRVGEYGVFVAVSITIVAGNEEISGTLY